MFSTANRKIEKYLNKHPEVKSIVIMGDYGRKSAIHALGNVLGQDFVVTMGINKKVRSDVVMLDYKAMDDFPNIEPDMVVITSCTSDEDAQKYFALANRARHVVINFCDVAQEYAKYLMNPSISTYGDELPADYYFENHDFTEDGYTGDIVNPDREHIPVTLKVLGEHNIRPIIMSAAVAKMFQMPREHIVNALENLHTLNGRMQPCIGLNECRIIDDSADISEVSVYYGLRTIYAIDAPSRIVIADNLAKLGDFDQSHIDEVCILGEPVEHKITGAKINFFADELSLVNYLGKRCEENGLILLEIPLPQIIQKRIWD